jgi:hypothetical protein
MTSPDALVLISIIVGGLLLVGANFVLQRVARPDHGTDRIAGSCGMAAPSAILDPRDGAA